MSTKTSRRRAALFDLDGVLIDSETIYSRLWGEIGRRYVPEIRDFAAIIKGSTMNRILATYFPDPDISQSVVKAVRDFETTMTFDPYPGVIDFINDLRRHGIATAIVTSSGPDKIAHLSRRQPTLVKSVDTIISAADVTRSKPDPEGYLIGAQRLGADPCDCFVFEDSLSGLQAGRASGARVIAVATTLPASSLQGYGHIVINSVADLTADTLLALFP